MIIHIQNSRHKTMKTLLITAGLALLTLALAIPALALVLNTVARVGKLLS